MVPRFHVVAHIRSCRLEYDPRATKFAGLLDYEGIERLWAPFGPIIGQVLHVFSLIFRWVQEEGLIS